MALSGCISVRIIRRQVARPTVFARTLIRGIRSVSNAMESQSNIADLQRENESLRREIAKLEICVPNLPRWPDRVVESALFCRTSGAELSRARRASAGLHDSDSRRKRLPSHQQVPRSRRSDLVLRWVAEFLEKSVRAHDVCCALRQTSSRSSCPTSAGFLPIPSAAAARQARHAELACAFLHRAQHGNCQLSRAGHDVRRPGARG